MRLVLILAFLLSACGQAGPLVLPEKKEAKPPPTQPPSAPEDIQHQKKQSVSPNPNPP